MSEEKRMGFLEHLEEIRSRLIISLIAIAVTTALAYVFADAILHVLISPVSESGVKNLFGESGQSLAAFGPMDGFMIHLRVALYGGIFLAAPVWLYQLVRFIEPGLLPTEKRLIVPGVIALVVLFLLGNVFGFLMLRNMMGVLSSMFGSEIRYVPGADQYISFVTYFLISTGIAFELPLVLLILMRMGIVSPQFVKKQRRVAYFILFVFAELITPVADPIVAPTVVMLPMALLFELALFASRFVVPKPSPAAPVAVAENRAE